VGKVNIPFEPAAFEALYNKVTTYLADKEVFVRDAYVCSDPNYRLNVRVITNHGQIYFATICSTT
jgi:phosphoenolpyruvate carboxykinase (ATP)